MRGNPLRQLGLVLVAFGLMAWPVWRLTRPALASAEPTEPAVLNTTAKAMPMELGVTAEFAPAPVEFNVTCLGQTVLEGKSQATASVAWKTTLPPEGADLVLHADWSKAAENPAVAAARISVRLPDGRGVEQSFWTKTGETLDAVFTVPGGAPTPQP